MGIVDGKKDSNNDYREEHDVGWEVLRRGREGESELLEIYLVPRSPSDVYRPRIYLDCGFPVF